jgi:hypothetical protein
MLISYTLRFDTELAQLFPLLRYDAVIHNRYLRSRLLKARLKKYSW